MVQKVPTNAGLYDQRIKIELNTATDSDKDSRGAQLEVWTDDYFYEMAAYEAMPSRPGGAEYDDGQTRLVEDRALFRVRNYALTSALTAGNARVVHNGKTWNIQRVFDPTGKRIEIHLETNSIV